MTVFFVLKIGIQFARIFTQFLEIEKLNERIIK